MAITGVSNPTSAADAAQDEWTIEELKDAKPLLMYYFRSETNPQADAYKFSRKLELGSMQDKVVEQIQKNWRCKKLEIDLDADEKVEKNQTRVEFWSFTGSRMGEITYKQQQILNAGPLRVKLKQMQDKNRQICDREIKRLEAIAKAEKEAEEASNK